MITYLHDVYKEVPEWVKMLGVANVFVEGVVTFLKLVSS